MKDIIKFIDHFNGSEKTFLNGCCYWFAFILQERFHGRGYVVDILHDPVEGHFVARFRKENNNDNKNAVNYKFFDVRGDVTNKYKDKYLENIWNMSFEEEKRFSKLMCDCRDFIEPNEYPDSLKDIID